jgi:D-glycero-alpha-D-manno-heptose-7-phosphate kinase
MKKTGMTKGVDIYTIGDIGAGTGLGSSSSITVGLLKAMYEYQGNSVSSKQIAEEACEIEREILGKPIGVQDQYIAAFGGFRFMNFDKSGINVSLKLDGRKLNERLLMFFTGFSHKSEEILTEQKRSVGINILNLGKLEYMARQALGYLGNEDYDAMGYLLNESWEAKKTLSSNISNPKLDEMYNLAISGGATGGKITGAGGGGYLLVYTPPEKREAVRKAMRNYRELSFNFEPDGSKVVYNK